MSQDEIDTIDEVNMNQAYDDIKQEGQHSEKWCKMGLGAGKLHLTCSDCQRAAEAMAIPQEDIKQFDKWGSKDARISFLSVFSSLIGSDKCQEMSITEIEDMAYQIVEELFNKYPTQ